MDLMLRVGDSAVFLDMPARGRAYRSVWPWLHSVGHLRSGWGGPFFRQPTRSGRLSCTVGLPCRCRCFRLLRRSLEKDPKKRLRDLRDARLEIADASLEVRPVASARATRLSRRERWVWASGIACREGGGLTRG